MRRPRRGIILLVSAWVVAAACAGCAAPAPGTAQPRAVATTPILEDLVREVAGEDTHVDGLIPRGADPHTYEPTLRAVRNIANADTIFYNGLLLEPQSMTAALTSAGRVAPVAVAEDIVLHGGELLPLVEDVSLDTVWLGLRAASNRGAQPTVLTATQASGPGTASAYVTGTFGAPDKLFAGYEAGSITLPAGAHTHMSWAFTEPGRYTLRFSATGYAPLDVEFAVGVAPETPGKEVVQAGHLDIRADEATHIIDLAGDNGTVQSPVIAVPATSVDTVPGDPAFRFVGKPGSSVYILPQAVAGKHMHGEVDPHVWHSARNAEAMVEVIAERLTMADPKHATGYRARADKLRAEIAQADTHMREAVAALPPTRRHLITSHEGYAYLAHSYGLTLSGIVSPNEDVEPSARSLTALSRAVDDLAVPAVFEEPAAERRANHLTTIAHDHGVRVCRIYGDAFAPPVTSYVQLMNFNADSLLTCLKG